MSWVMAGVAVVGGGIKMYQGMKQKEEGQRMASELDKPQFQIPPEIEKNMSMADKLEYQGLPPEQKQAFLDNQQRALQSALRSSSDRRGGLGVISQLQGQQNVSSRQLMLDDIKSRQDNMKFAMQQREVMAGYKMKRFEHQYNEYAADLDYARAIEGAGMQNQQSGMNTMISGAAQGIAGNMGGNNLRLGTTSPGNAIGVDQTQMKQSYVDPFDAANQNARANQQIRQGAGIYDRPEAATGYIPGRQKVFNEQTEQFEWK